VGLEPRYGQADEPDELGHAGYLDRPETEAVLCEVRLDPVGEAVALGARHRPREMLHHLGIGIHRRERRAVGGAPAAHHEALGAEGWRTHAGASSP